MTEKKKLKAKKEYLSISNMFSRKIDFNHGFKFSCILKDNFI
jgi:hypothetical protein